MATGTGLDAQIGYLAESAYGVGTAVTRFLPLVGETLSKEIEPIESDDILVGRQVMQSTQWAQGDATVGGEIQHELYTQSCGLLFRAAFGTVNTIGTEVPYSHEFWPAPPSVSLRVQVGRPLVYGTVSPFTYYGVKVNEWELAGAAGEFFTWGMTVIAQDETQGTALAAASYADNLRRWDYSQATVKIDGTIIPLKSFKIGGDNKLTDDRRFLGSTVISEPLREDLAEYTGELEGEWGNPSAFGGAAGSGSLLYNKFLTGSEGTLLATMVSGTLSGTIQANVRFDGTTPQVEGRGIVPVTWPFKAVAPGTLDSQALKVTLANNDSSA